MKVLSEVKTCLRAASDWGICRKHKCTWKTFFISGLWPRSALSWVFENRTMSRLTTHKMMDASACTAVRYLESHNENAKCVQHRQTDLCRHVGLQQALAAHIGFCMRVHCADRTDTRPQWATALRRSEQGPRAAGVSCWRSLLLLKVCAFSRVPSCCRRACRIPVLLRDTGRVRDFLSEATGPAASWLLLVKGKNNSGEFG